MDRNSTIGLVLISVILFAYFTFFNQTSNPPPVVETPKKVLLKSKTDSASVVKTVNALSDSNFVNVPAKDIVIENEKLKVVFSSVGGGIKSAELKEYKDYKKNQLVLLDEQSLDAKLIVPTTFGDVDLNSLNYVSAIANVFVKDTDSGSVVLETSVKGQKITQTFTLKKDGYLLSRKIDLGGLALKSNLLTFDFTNYVKRTEADPAISKGQTTVNYYTDSFSSLSETSNDKEEQELTNAKWFTFKSKFFLVGLIAENPILPIVPKRNIRTKRITFIR